MKILYIHQYFKTPEEGGAIRSYYLSTALARAGHEVHLITASNIFKGRRVIEGVNVYYLEIKYDNSFGPFKRIWAFCEFMFSAYKQSLRIRDIDLCYATSTPLSVGLLALLLKKMKRIPYYFEVRDLWPAAPIEMGYMRNSFIINLLLRLEITIYKHASKIVALSPGILEGIRAKTDNEISLIPNISDCEFFQSILESVVSEQITIAYIGTFGKANDVPSLLNLAKHCKAHNVGDVQFVIAGDGAEKSLLISKIKNEKLDNVTYLGSLNKGEVRDLLQRCDAVYISFADYPILSTCSPNKFFDSLAAGKVILTNYKGWLTDLVLEHKAGFFIDRNNLKDFIANILPVIRNRAVRNEMQTNSYQLAKSQFDRRTLENKFLALFKNS